MGETEKRSPAAAGTVWTGRSDTRTETFGDDFAIADAFGPSAVDDTFRRALADIRAGHLNPAGLVATLNEKMWDWFGREGGVYGPMTTLYHRLWIEASRFACETMRPDGRELRRTA